MMVSATNRDAAIVQTTAIGSERVKSPAASGRFSKGRKASNSVAVQPTTAMLISLTPAMAASRGLRPLRLWRAMFSVTTMESSTRSPSAITKPAIDNWFSEYPIMSSAMTPMAKEAGIDTITTMDARRPNGRRVNSTRPMAIIKSRPSVVRRLATVCD